MYQDLVGKYDALVREVMAMKREGFAAPLGSDLTPRPEQQLDAEIVRAITETVDAVEGEADLEQHLVEQAWRLQRSGAGPEEIAQRIREGEPVPA